VIRLFLFMQALSGLYRPSVLMCGVVFFSLLVSHTAFADSTPTNREAVLCNTSESFETTMGVSTEDGLRIFERFGSISTVAGEIGAILKDAWQLLYQGIINYGLPQIGAAMMILMVVIFGIMFALGVVQMPLNEVLKRVMKMIVVGLVLTSMAFFEEYFYGFFHDGIGSVTAAMVEQVANTLTPTAGGISSTCATGAGSTGVGDPIAARVFAPMDQLFCDLLRPENLMIVEAALGTPPYGIVYAVAVGLGTLFTFGAIARAVWVYLMALMTTSFLFGLAPIFIIFILFERTKNMFNAWLNQLINFSLQPLLMFTFITFFIVLMHQSLEVGMFGTQVCFGTINHIQGFEALGEDISNRALQFTDGQGNIMLASGDWEGLKCVQNGQFVPCTEPFPIDFMALLTFVILAFVAFQFYNYVIDIANDIAGSFISLEMGSPVQQGIQTVTNNMNNAIAAMAQGKSSGEVMRAAGLASAIDMGGTTPPPATPPTAEQPNQRQGGPQEE